MNYLAIDLWDKRCGLAYSVEWYIFQLPFVERVKIMWTLKKVCEEKDISKIIVGLPYDLYGKKEKQLVKTKTFIQKLQDLFPHLEVVWVDERFTTQESLHTLIDMWEKNIRDKKDSLSAYFILETYLHQIKNS